VKFLSILPGTPTRLTTVISRLGSYAGSAPAAQHADPRKHRRPARRCEQDQGFRRLLSHRRLVELGLKGEEMTKTPGEFEPPKPISKAERDARKTFRKLDAEKAMTEHEIEQKAFSANRERLKAERLTREAAAPPVAAKKAKTKRKAR
jgi:hypothetical protein